MTIITSNAVILTTNADAIFQTEDSLVVDTSAGPMIIQDIPSDALSQVAIAIAEKQEIVELYSIPYTTRVFSMGDVNGLPYYIAELMNRILCLSDVKINGESFVREGNSKPEKVETLGRKELFIWSITLRLKTRRISGIGGKVEEPYSASGASFKLNKPEDGEVLVYDNSENSFVNSNTLSSL